MPAAVINDQNPNAHRTIIAIVFPAILANSSAPLVGLVDTWAIGHLPVVAVASYQFDGVYIAATAGAAMMLTMAVAFTAYILVLNPMTMRWGIGGLWGAVLVFMAMRGIAQAIWYPKLESKLNRK